MAREHCIGSARICLLSNINPRIRQQAINNLFKIKQTTIDIVLNHTPCGTLSDQAHTHHVSQNHTIWGGRVEKPPALIPCCLAYFLLYQTLETRRSLSVSCCIAPVTFSLYFAGLQNSSDTCDRDWYNKEQEQASTMTTS